MKKKNGNIILTIVVFMISVFVTIYDCIIKKYTLAYISLFFSILLLAILITLLIKKVK
ncbi:MAG: hypothetical protein IKF82_01055 [Bacilli bacterium]|nr:hypothetical protein [Bacilli bacterium]